MTTVQENYAQAARAAVALLREPAVAAAWDQPSALPEFSVRGLAGHLGSQVLHVSRLLAGEPPEAAPLSFAEFFTAAAFETGIDSEINIRIREGGESAAADGSEALADAVESALGEQRTTVLAESAERVVAFAAGPMRLGDFLLTRMMEIAVHSDDLATSVGIATPRLPAEVIEPVVDLLTRQALRRHGQAAVLRALSRAERAPTTITAI
ncbi:maleylpyruvate isomerase N-terminal domain-containing protein [Saccharopolyspora griseoalba]|uniref:Maleylpyruvate isomerase N-terminal domain-containing protein n=1 Tax=Saccharopolyspora griseoalba TaxID=1431848 RepID=A0ABW2LKI5_9PSEU